MRSRVILVFLAIGGCATTEAASQPEGPRVPPPDQIERLQLVGEPIRGSLENLPQLVIPATTGQCYTGFMILDNGAVLHDRAFVGYSVTGPSFRRGTDMWEAGRGMYKGNELCLAAETGRVELFHAEVAAVPTASVGRGGFTFRLYQRATTSEELEQEKLRWMGTRCVQCKDERTLCEQTKSPQECFTQFQTCLQGAGMQTAQCPWER